ncbi:hypothetical protein ANCDUO_04336 [Ancylostoma duodenale]|uniref:ATP-dependent DNA helicase n=1 Tax=Ancylostoma duodenale TaxID=51022 RepID=A0A0C2GV78_9BILA|nr:hypothetical protein ANCDUO_04336 [Ancylostoma duodenale]
MKREEKEARALAEVKVFVWDEASMIPRNASETVDKLLRDIMQNDHPFGGKMMVLSGDFKQVFPVVQGGERGDTVNSCTKNSALWSQFIILELTSNMRVTRGEREWIDSLLKVGSAAENDENGRISLPDETMCTDPILRAVYGETINASDKTTRSTRAILAPRMSTS